MKTLQNIKDDYAQEQGYEDWEDLIHSVINHAGIIGRYAAIIAVEKHLNEICIRAQKAALENAAEKLERKIELTSEMGMEKENWAFSQSYRIVTNPENLIL